MDNKLDITKHPCFNGKVKGTYGRIHLPVAPKCNIQCNYCNRKYDCLNESRPGVTSAVLSPKQAITYMEEVLEREPRITTVGIAGPGDPMANPAETLTTLRIVRKKWPDMLLCLASNGLDIMPYIGDLAEIGISHVTLTINAIDTQLSRLMYAWVRHDKVVYRGPQAAEVLLKQQLAAIRKLKELGIIVKVNTIIVPGINESHTIDLARKMSEMGVDILNCMPMYPSPDTIFEHLPEPSVSMIGEIRKEAGKFLLQMLHCTRCRADAVGLLGEDRSLEFHSCLVENSKLQPLPTKQERPYVAVASLEGALVNQHLGRAEHLLIYKQNNGSYELVEERKTPEPGTGGKRWFDMANVLSDCRAVVVSAIGQAPQTILEEEGIRVIEMYGVIEDALDIAFNNKKAKGFQKRRVSCTAGQCHGAGAGCG